MYSALRAPAGAEEAEGENTESHLPVAVDALSKPCPLMCTSLSQRWEPSDDQWSPLRAPGQV